MEGKMFQQIVTSTLLFGEFGRNLASKIQKKESGIVTALSSDVKRCNL